MAVYKCPTIMIPNLIKVISLFCCFICSINVGYCYHSGESGYGTTYIQTEGYYRKIYNKYCKSGARYEKSLPGCEIQTYYSSPAYICKRACVRYRKETSNTPSDTTNLGFLAYWRCHDGSHCDCGFCGGQYNSKFDPQYSGGTFGHGCVETDRGERLLPNGCSRKFVTSISPASECEAQCRHYEFLYGYGALSEWHCLEDSQCRCLYCAGFSPGPWGVGPGLPPTSGSRIGPLGGPKTGTNTNRWTNTGERGPTASVTTDENGCRIEKVTGPTRCSLISTRSRSSSRRKTSRNPIRTVSNSSQRDEPEDCEAACQDRAEELASQQGPSGTRGRPSIGAQKPKVTSVCSASTCECRIC